MPLDYDRLASETLSLTKALLAKELAPLREANDALRNENAELRERLAAVEQRPEPEPKADPTETAATIKAMIDAAVSERVSEAVAGIKAPEVPDVRPMVDAAVRAAVDALPTPEPVDLSGLATKVEVDEVRAALAVPPAPPPAPDLSGFATKDDLAEVVAAIPAPADLSDIATKAELAEVKAAVAAIRIPAPVPGKDGRGIEDVKVNDDREVIVKFTDGETKNLGSFDGRHGLGFEDMHAEWDGERTLTLRWVRGEQAEEKAIRLPVMIYRGVWREGEYERGDTVTWGGSLWVALEDTTDKPETGKAWQLAAKRGRDYRQPVKS